MGMNDAYFHLLKCQFVVTALHTCKCQNCSHWAVSAAVVLINEALVCVDIGQEPACLFWLRSSCAFSSVDNSSYPLFNTRAEWVQKCSRKQFIAFTSLVKIQTNWKLWLLHMVIEAKWIRPHVLQQQDVWQPMYIILSEIDHVIPFVCTGLLYAQGWTETVLRQSFHPNS